MLNKITKSKLLKLFFIKIKSSFAFKLLLVGCLILFTFSITIYYIEKSHVLYKYENGVKVEDSDNSSNIRTFEDSVWWAFVTSTTVGYGDYFPKSFAGRLVGILLMFFGISLVGVITGNIASVLVEKQLKEGRGLRDLNLKNHFIICGWKRDMGQFLHDILDKNKSYIASELVLINTASMDEIDNMKSDKDLEHVNYIHGDFIDEKVLHRANLKEAKRVLVLADRLVQGSVQEVDSRTVMAIITIKSISKSVYTAAELLDSKFKNYLTFSNCDEIILSSEYNRSLIANASSGSGISHVVSELLSVTADVSIDTYEIPSKFIGKSYEKLFNHYREKNNSVLIGILENTGNFYYRKKEAIKEAQKTPDISKLVDNLKTVKGLHANEPIINPPQDYILKKYSKAIIIEGRN